MDDLFCLYFGKPNSDGFFISNGEMDKKCVDNVSIYEFKLRKDDEHTADFWLINKKYVCEIISKNEENWKSYIDPVCKYGSKYPQKRIKSVETEKPGVVTKSKSGNWKISSKAEIKYTECDDLESGNDPLRSQAGNEETNDESLNVTQETSHTDDATIEQADNKISEARVPDEEPKFNGLESNVIAVDMPSAKPSEEKIDNSNYSDENGERYLPKPNDLCFAVIGAKNVGKSSYIAVLKDTIDNKLCRTFDMNLQPLNDDTMERYSKYYKYILRDNKITDAMPSAYAKRPLLYSLSYMKHGLFGKDKVADVRKLALFDTAGYNLNEWDGMEDEKKLKNINYGIILLIDARQSMSSDARDVVKKVVGSIRDRLRRKYGNPGKKIDIPIAIVLSKIDMLKDNFGMLCDEKEDGGDGDINRSDADNVRNEIMGLCGGEDGDLVKEVKDEFKNYEFFGVSSLGSEPIPDGTVPGFRPIRVEDPFLWLLHKNNFKPKHGRFLCS